MAVSIHLFLPDVCSRFQIPPTHRFLSSPQPGASLLGPCSKVVTLESVPQTNKKKAKQLGAGSRFQFSIRSRCQFSEEWALRSAKAPGVDSCAVRSCRCVVQLSKWQKWVQTHQIFQNIPRHPQVTVIHCCTIALLIAIRIFQKNLTRLPVAWAWSPRAPGEPTRSLWSLFLQYKRLVTTLRKLYGHHLKTFYEILLAFEKWWRMMKNQNACKCVLHLSSWNGPVSIAVGCFPTWRVWNKATKHTLHLGTSHGGVKTTVNAHKG